MKANDKSSGTAASVAQSRHHGELGVSLAAYPADMKDGANHFKLLLERIRNINDTTCDRFGEGLDGRDYKLIAEELELAVRHHLIEHTGAHKEGFLRAFCDYMSLGADGCGEPRNWDPLSNTEVAFAHPGALSDNI